MNHENINTILVEIKELQQRGFNILLDTETIMSDFESLNELSRLGKNNLPARYRFIKGLQDRVYRSLAGITENQVSEFIPLCRAVEKIRLGLSQEYETRKLISTRVRRLKGYIKNLDTEMPCISDKNTSVSDYEADKEV